MLPDLVTDFDLNAYVDGELDASRQLVVEHHLAHHPALAARVMADLCGRHALRFAEDSKEAEAPALAVAAKRLAARFRQRRWFGLIVRDQLVAATIVAMAALSAVLFFRAPDATAATPEFVSDAVSAYETGLLRWKMPSQIENPFFDAADVYRATRIRVPRLPDRWRISDVQIVPDEDGPALQLMVQTESGLISVFAMCNPVFSTTQPITIRRGNTSIAYWRHGNIAYALTGLEAPAALDVAARDLADNRLD